MHATPQDFAVRSERARRLPTAPTRAVPPARRRFSVAASALLASLLSACASSPGPKVEVDQAAVDRYRASGYAFTHLEGVTVRRFTAPVTQIPWSFTLIEAPGPVVNRPVVLYLPALGDSDDATCRWVDLWARAGYAVISIQALDDDARIWTTPEARSGDFERVARGRFTDDLMSDRIARLSVLVAQTRARTLAGEPALAGLDWSHVAIAGTDLGAYTVQTLAAMSQEQLAGVAWPVTPMAYLVISPFAWQSRPAAAARARAPVLMVSSLDDVDAYGVITDVSLRRLAFDLLASGDDTYFELASATHRWLSGVVSDINGPDANARRTPIFRESPVGSRPRPSGDSDGLAPEDDLSPDAKAKLASNRKEREIQLANARSRLLTMAAKSEVGVEDVTIAFLDTYVRQDARAHAWLADSAPAWLQDGDRLKHR